MALCRSHVGSSRQARHLLWGKGGQLNRPFTGLKTCKIPSLTIQMLVSGRQRFSKMYSTSTWKPMETGRQFDQRWMRSMGVVPWFWRIIIDSSKGRYGFSVSNRAISSVVVLLVMARMCSWDRMLYSSRLRETTIEILGDWKRGWRGYCCVEYVRVIRGLMRDVQRSLCKGKF